MVDPVEMDCRGMKCPRPIIEIAKAARRLPPAALLRITADDLAFESDVRAWCETRNAELLSMEKEGTLCVALVKMPD